jgi:hypothetical protein
MSADHDVSEPANGQEPYTDSARAALAILEENSRFPRASSPQSRQEETKWLLTIPSIRKFDRQILNCFLSKFMKHVVPIFCSFKGFKVDEGTTSEKILAMAAVGGLFCTTNGSFQVARAMCSDARRLHLNRVHTYSLAKLTVPELMEHQMCITQTVKIAITD